jgi:hypothetical protein
LFLDDAASSRQILPQFLNRPLEHEHTKRQQIVNDNPQYASADPQSSLQKGISTAGKHYESTKPGIKEQKKRERLETSAEERTHWSR